MTPPDSDAHEVTGEEAWRRGFREGWACARDDAASSHPAGFAEPPPDYPYTGTNAIPRDLVSLPLPLAQRILAALEYTHEAHCVSLAAELRAVIGK